MIPRESSTMPATNRGAGGRQAFADRVKPPAFAGGTFLAGFLIGDPADGVLATDHQSMPPTGGSQMFRPGVDARFRSEASARQGRLNEREIIHPPEATRISWAASHAP